MVGGSRPRRSLKVRGGLKVRKRMGGKVRRRMERMKRTSMCGCICDSEDEDGSEDEEDQYL
jgi:hypothetical protein